MCHHDRSRVAELQKTENRYNGAAMPTTSLDDTVVVAGSGAAIIDAAGDRWTISSANAVLKNGRAAAFTANVAEIAYVKSVIWHENTADQWYEWTGSGWTSGQNPLPPPLSPADQILALLQAVLPTLATKQELQAMGTTLGQQLDTAQTQEQTDAATTQADISKLTTDIGTLVAAFQGAQVGQPITQAQVDAANTLDQTLKSMDTAVQAADATVTGASPAPAPTGTPVPPGAPTDGSPTS